MELDVKRVSAIFRAFGDENRIRILQKLISGEKCACKLLEEMNITQPTLSHHMKILCDSGIVNGRRDGKWMYYSISGEGIEFVCQYLNSLKKANNTENDRREGSKQP